MFPSSNSMNLAIGVPPWLWKLNGMLQNQRNPHPTVGVVGITAGPRGEHMQYNSTTQYNAISYYIILYHIILYYIILYIYIVVIIIITIVIIYNYIYNYKYMFFHIIIICIYNFVY